MLTRILIHSTNWILILFNIISHREIKRYDHFQVNILFLSSLFSVITYFPKLIFPLFSAEINESIHERIFSRFAHKR